MLFFFVHTRKVKAARIELTLIVPVRSCRLLRRRQLPHSLVCDHVKKLPLDNDSIMCHLDVLSRACVCMVSPIRKFAPLETAYNSQRSPHELCFISLFSHATLLIRRPIETSESPHMMAERNCLVSLQALMIPKGVEGGRWLTFFRLRKFLPERRLAF